MDKDKLLSLIEDDDLGILKVKSKSSGAATSDERLAASFQEINEFIDKHGREPDLSHDIQERRLHNVLKSLRSDAGASSVLADADVHGLLETKVKPITSLEDIFDDDDMGIFDNEAESIFTLKHVSKETNMPDYIASRKPCEDFEAYEEKFMLCQSDLASGERSLRPFAKGTQIEKGQYFVLKGILLYVDSVGKKETVDGRTNARLRVIFENGTESDMLLRSLAAELYKDGRRVSEHGDKLLDGFGNITEEDEETGYIYILKSLSDNPEIKGIDNLYKIGFSRTPVEERIKNAEQEPTYLLAPVAIVTTFRCYNMNPQKLEKLLHQFFGSACLNVDIFDHNRKRYTPREWFVAPLEIIEQAIHFLLSGEIVDYKYKPDTHEIITKG
ncbi:MAG: GIY-YIG nuclease family protein [Proteobacteria bacterium]|nr:GIY-YIG nuclease family protein [Pseudomonadota bacterium]MDA1056363.1 GIY-YIG nuclease family protein [Pseudomonadota bacterium]